jgi:mRNA-degrading endonuclease RelE of RelBE toxin-antitoxin system
MSPQHVVYLRQQYVGDDVIERWYDRLFVRLEHLETWPKMYPVDERLTREFGREVRKPTYGRYVITYEIDEPTHRVYVPAMIHSARRK